MRNFQRISKDFCYLKKNIILCPIIYLFCSLWQVFHISLSVLSSFPFRIITFLFIFFIRVWGGLHYTVLLFPAIFIILFFVGGVFPDILVMIEVTITKSY